MNRWFAGRVVRVQGTVVKVRVGMKRVPFTLLLAPKVRPQTAFMYLVQEVDDETLAHDLTDARDALLEAVVEIVGFVVPVQLSKREG